MRMVARVYRVIIALYKVVRKLEHPAKDVACTPRSMKRFLPLRKRATTGDAVGSCAKKKVVISLFKE